MCPVGQVRTNRLSLWILVPCRSGADQSSSVIVDLSAVEDVFVDADDADDDDDGGDTREENGDDMSSFGIRTLIPSNSLQTLI